jgi:hypothetical protein
MVWRSLLEACRRQHRGTRYNLVPVFPVSSYVLYSPRHEEYENCCLPFVGHQFCKMRWSHSIINPLQRLYQKVSVRSNRESTVILFQGSVERFPNVTFPSVMSMTLDILSLHVPACTPYYSELPQHLTKKLLCKIHAHESPASSVYNHRWINPAKTSLEG